MVRSGRGIEQLNDEQIAFLQQLIDDASPGEHEAIELVRGEEQYFYVDPRAFGRQLKAAVTTGRLRGIRFLRTETDNHAIYQIG
jgi:hypothetical protein